MKFTTKLLLFWISIFLAFYLVVIVTLILSFGIDANIWQLMLVFSITGVLPPMLVSVLFHQRLDYMESDDINPPQFRGQKEATVKIAPRTKCLFDEVLQKADRHWIISFSDRTHHVLKFRTDARIMSWGIGGYIRLIGDNTLQVIVYPMFRNSLRDEQIMDQTLQMVKTVFGEKCTAPS